MILRSLFVTIAVVAKSSAIELPNLGLHNFLDGGRSPNNAPWHHGGSNSNHGRGNGRGFDNGNTSCNPTSNDIADQDCQRNHWCRLNEAGTCPKADVEQEGTCEPLIPFCRLRSMIWTCGCDGNWYQNPSCTNGVNVQDDSKCPPREEGVASLRTPELLQEDGVNSECVRQCTSYFQGKDPNSQPNSQNAPDYCHNNENLYGVDLNKCMKDYKDLLESLGSTNGNVGYWCTNKICQA